MSTAIIRTKLAGKLFTFPTSTTVRSMSYFRRPFSASPAQVRRIEDDDDNLVDSSRRSSVLSRPSFFSEVFDPFSPTRSLPQLLNLMDQLTDVPFQAPVRSGAGRRGWGAREDSEGLSLRIDMPGLGKEDVQVTIEQNVLVIKGEESEKEVEGGDEDGGARRYSTRIDLPEKIYKSDQIKAEMKNGVLKVFVPKVKEEENKNVLQVKID